MTPREAAKPFILEREGIKVGFYPCAEHEFSIVTENSPGANPFDPMWSLDHRRRFYRMLHGHFSSSNVSAKLSIKVSRKYTTSGSS